jgi:hypothetical protein
MHEHKHSDTRTQTELIIVFNLTEITRVFPRFSSVLVVEQKYWRCGKRGGQ